MEDGLLRFLDFNASCPDHSDSPLGLSLRPLFDLIYDSFDTLSLPSIQPLLILDDISALEWVGYSMDEINRFCRALFAFCAKVRLLLIDLCRIYYLTHTSYFFG